MFLSTGTCCLLTFTLQSMIICSFSSFLAGLPNCSSLNTTAFVYLIFLSLLWLICLWTLPYWFGNWFLHTEMILNANIVLHSACNSSQYSIFYIVLKFIFHLTLHTLQSVSQHYNYIRFWNRPMQNFVIIFF